MDTVYDITGGADDIVLPFQVDALDVRGRLVRLGPSLTEMIDRHAYPAPVSRALAEATALTMLLASAMKFDGRLILQTQTDGPLRMLVVDVQTPDRVRALARYDEARLAEAVETGAVDPALLLGRGQMVMTIDQGVDMQRYQGIVALEGQGLEKAADLYFRQSEQIETRVRLAAAEEMVPGPAGMARNWRAGGILVQHFPKSGPRRAPDLPPGDAPVGYVAEEIDQDDAWAEARAIADTVGDDELVDRTLSPERLLFRLYHERGVRVFDPLAVEAVCTCTEERVAGVIRSFSPEERHGMVEDGAITVTCDYCSKRYRFDPASFGE